jgi:DNA-binding PadR family transcriptional regulator
MYDVFVPIRADGETAQLIDSLVANGFMEETVALEPDERCFRVTDKGARFLSKTEELTGLANRAPTSGPLTGLWDLN